MPGKKEQLPLSVTHPELAAEADGWMPNQFTAGSNKMKNWKCKLGHCWSAKIGSRTYFKLGCPVCSNQQILAGYNDLLTINPALAVEADGWDPTKIGAGSNRNVKWKCRKSHSWQAKISHRNSGASCPFCTNQKVLSGFNDLATTHPEIAREANGWDPTQFISGSNKSFEWECKLGHIYKSSISERKIGNGCPICSNHQVLRGFNDLSTTHPIIALEADGWDPDTVISGSNARKNWKCKLGHTWLTSPKSRISGNNCPYCGNKKVLSGFNDLMTTHPHLGKMAIGWDPRTIIAGNDKLQEWLCPKKHKFVARTTDLVKGKTCGVCANRQVLAGWNDLASRFPEIANEADGWDPKKVLFGSNKKFPWICVEGHRWETVLINRTFRGDGCPSCAKYGFDPSIDSFLYFLQHKNWEMFQIGITNVPEIRLAKHKKIGWELLELRGPMDGHLTQQWETAILRMLKAKGADLSNSKIAGKFDGYSEAWSKATFEVKSIKELMRLTEEFEEK